MTAIYHVENWLDDGPSSRWFRLGSGREEWAREFYAERLESNPDGRYRLVRSSEVIVEETEHAHAQ